MIDYKKEVLTTGINSDMQWFVYVDLSQKERWFDKNIAIFNIEIYKPIVYIIRK